MDANNQNEHKLVKAILSIIISFLMIFIVALFVRSISNTVLPKDNKLAILVNDYLDMMSIMTEKLAVGMRIKRNSVSEYQVNLITQSISDYVGYSLYQTSSIVKDYNPNAKYSDKELDKYKVEYYKMTLENPYLRGLSVFNIDGKMRLNLYLPQAKSWPLELQESLINDIKAKGSLVLNATNENTFYIMEYIRNKNGELIVATRNDYSYVSDIATYYQIADKRLYVSDSRDFVYSVKESIGDNNLDKVSSVINKFAFYKKQPSFVVSDSLSVSLVGKEYPNYFELMVLAITALLILVFQLIINSIGRLIKHVINVINNKAYVESLHSDKGSIKDTIIDESLINADLPEATAQEDMPPIIQKLHYKIPEEYAVGMEENKVKRFSMRDNILNAINVLKSEMGVNVDENNEEEINNNIENEISSIENIDDSNRIEIIEENKEDISIEEALDSIVDTDKIIEEHSSIDSDEYENFTCKNNIVVESSNDASINELQTEEDDDYQFDEGVDYYNYSNSDDTIDSIHDSIENIDTDTVEVKKEVESQVVEDLEAIEKVVELKEIVEPVLEDNVSEEYASINEFDNYNKKDADSVWESVDSNNIETANYTNAKESILEKKIVKSDILSSYAKEEEPKTFKTSNNSVLESYNSSNRKIDTSNTDDVFAAFDKMLSSIISKAEEDARKTISNRSTDNK